MTTIKNAAPAMNVAASNKLSQPLNTSIIRDDKASFHRDELKCGLRPPVGPSIEGWIRAKAEITGRALEKAEQRLADARDALKAAKTPGQRAAAMLELRGAEQGFKEAKLNHAEARLDVAELDVRKAQSRVDKAEEAVQNARNPLARMIAIRELKAATRDLVKVEGERDKVKQEVWNLRLQDVRPTIHDDKPFFDKAKLN